AHTRPEILEADLLPMALDLAAWGIGDPNELSWLDAPPGAAFAQAREVLFELGAIDHAGTITEHGRSMIELPYHPRIAHMILRGRDLGLEKLASQIADAFDERSANRRTVHHAKTGLLLAFAYPDRIGLGRGKRGKFVLRNGRGAFVDEADPLAGEDFIVAAELQGSGRDSRIYYGAAVSEADIREHFGDQIEERISVEFNSAGNVNAVVREQLGAIVLKESPSPNVPPDALAAALIADIETRGFDSLPWNKTSTQLRERMAFMHSIDPNNWPSPTLDATRQTLDARLQSARGRSDVNKLDMHEILNATLTWQQRAQLDRDAPTHITVPSGSNIYIDYSDAAAPFAAVRLQEVFGLKGTPHLGAGRVPLTLHLLSPAQRPVQVTRDLASFWQTGYFDVKKELKGRYPKHYWPDDPLVAEPTRRTRPR
ncbi:MAG TPA: ATP-dependent helicase C-terminal domain-containing protein, partial [Longimicrobiales bacterium]|nr:ATP-dependent helicase C-terminal domain-containing protein [Longimicrobiales bacterium]